jgi:ankyrin repeat protein
MSDTEDDHGADPNGRWPHRDADVTPHLAASRGHAEIVRLLREAGADPTIRDSKHDSDAIGWAAFFSRPEIVETLGEHGPKTQVIRRSDRCGKRSPGRLHWRARYTCGHAL